MFLEQSLDFSVVGQTIGFSVGRAVGLSVRVLDSRLGGGMVERLVGQQLGASTVAWTAASPACAQR